MEHAQHTDERVGWLTQAPFIAITKHARLPAPARGPSLPEPHRDVRAPPRPASVGTSRSPGNITLLRVTQMPIFPEAVRGLPLFESPIGAYAWSGNTGKQDGSFTVFDRVRHYTVERAARQSTIHEVVPLAISSAPFTVGAIPTFDGRRPEADGTGHALDAAFPLLLSRSKLRRPQVPRILESCPGKVGLIRLRAIADVLS